MLLFKAAHHCHSVGGQQLLRGHGGEVGNVGHRVDKRHQWDGNVDGTGQVPKNNNISNGDKSNFARSSKLEIRQVLQSINKTKCKNIIL